MSDLISREYMKNLGATCIASRSKDGNMFPIVSIDELPSVQPDVPDTNVGELISRQAAIDLVESFYKIDKSVLKIMVFKLKQLPSVQPTILTEDDKETIRIHLSAFKERLCNQCRWNEAKEYEELISRLLSTPSVQPELSSNSQELNRGNGDLISRQDVKDWLARWEGYLDEDMIARMQMKVADMPSVQPEIIRCKDCKWCSEHYDTDGNVPYWVCINWDAGTDADGFCHEAELRGDSE